MPKNKIKNLWPYSLILIITLFFFWPLFFRQKIFLFGALETHHYPWKVFYSQSLAKGQLPLWDPTVGHGFPLLADGKIGALYLPNLILYYLLPVNWAYNLSFFLHFFLGALFMFFFARTLSFSRSSGLFISIAFVFGGFMSGYLEQLHILSAFIYLPLIFALLNLYFQNPKTLHLVGIALAWALQFCTGAFPMAAATALAAAFYVLFPSTWKSIKEKNFNYLRQDFIWLFCTALLALILSLGQLLPAYELNNFPSVKTKVTPLVYNGGLWEDRLGWIPLILAFFSLWSGKSKVRIFFLILSLFSILAGILLYIFYFRENLSDPWMFSFINPYPLMGLMVFSISILAGYGLERLRQEELSLKKLWPFLPLLLLQAATVIESLYKANSRSRGFSFEDLVITLFLLMVFFYYKKLLRASAITALTIMLAGSLYFLNFVSVAQSSTEKFPVPSAQVSPFSNKEEALERAYIAHNLHIFPVGDVKSFPPEERAIQQRIAAEAIFMAKDLSLEEEPPPDTKPQSETLSGDEQGEVIQVRYQNQKVDIKVVMQQKGWLVLKDNYYPGWEAWVDGKQTKIYRGNYVMRAVFLEAGKHEVEFIYRPKVFKWGMVMTILGILVAVKLSWWSIKTQ